MEHLHLLLIASQFFWIKAELLLFETWVCHGSRGNRARISVLVGVDVALGYSYTTQFYAFLMGALLFTEVTGNSARGRITESVQLLSPLETF